MGLFDKKEKESCSVCGDKIGILNIKSCDGRFCPACYAKCTKLYSTWNLLPSERIKEHIKQREINSAEYASFSPTDSVDKYILVDRNSKRWCVPELDKVNPDIFCFSDIVNYALLEDGITSQEGGLGSAVAGGLIFGGSGAIVGATIGKKSKAVCSNLSIRIAVENPIVYQVEIPFLKNIAVKKDSFLYRESFKQAQSVISLLELMSASSNASNAPASCADELLKLKNLLDSGVLTQSEFDGAKSRLLK